MTTNDPNDEGGTPRSRSPIAAGAILLGIYITMYLAVWGALHLQTSPDAAAAASNGSTAPP